MNKTFPGPFFVMVSSNAMFVSDYTPRLFTERIQAGYLITCPLCESHDWYLADQNTLRRLPDQLTAHKMGLRVETRRASLRAAELDFAIRGEDVAPWDPSERPRWAIEEGGLISCASEGGAHNNSFYLKFNQ